jgi:hypothetical protein
VPGKPICLAWNQRTFTYNVHSLGSARTPGTAEFDAIDAAFNSWRDVAARCSDFQFYKGPLLNAVKVGYDPSSSGNRNIITFREVACRDVVSASDACWSQDNCGNTYNCWNHDDGIIALTTATFSFKTGIIYDADIEFNAAPQSGGRQLLFTAVDDPLCVSEDEQTPNCVATDIQNTLTHEIGHVLGLDHVLIPFSTMEPTANLGEKHKRIIDAGTQAGFCDTYPPDLPATQCDLEVNRKAIRASTAQSPLFRVAGCSATSGNATHLWLIGVFLLLLRVTKVG